MAFNIRTTSFSQYSLSYMDWSNLYYVSGSLILYDNGCNYNGTLNCTRACQDPGKVWGDSWRSLPTLHNCIVYPAIAQIWGSNNLSESAIETAREFGIERDRNSPLFNSWPTIKSCIDSFCENVPDGRIQGCEPPLSDYRYQAWFYSNASTYRDTFDITLDFNVRMCLDAPRDLGINLDLGGIGMLVSYISQVSAVLAVCLVWHCLNDWAQITAWIFHKVRRRTTDPRKAARDFQQRLIDSRYYASFIKLLAEFQKAQVFFICAVEVAALIALHDPSKLADDSSGSNPDSRRATNDLLNNIDIFMNLAFAGTLPIVLCLLILRLAGTKDSYTVAITTCPIALAPAIWGLARSKLNRGGVPDIEAGDGPSQCANVKPLVFCYPLERNTTNPFVELTSIGILSFCVLVHICIILEHVRIFPKHGSQALQQAGRGNSTGARSSRRLPWNVLASIPTAYAGLTHADASGDIPNHRQDIFSLLQDTTQRADASRPPASRQRTWISRLLLPGVARFAIYAAELALFGLNCMLLHQYVLTLHPGEGYRLEDFDKWTLGQVIAVTIWFPVLFEFLWDSYRGVIRTIEDRLLPPTYKVVQIKSNDIGRSSGGTSSTTELNPLPPIGPYEPLAGSTP